jgi:transposase-like protein
LRSTKQLARVNREIARRAGVVGILPNDAAAIVGTTRRAARPQAGQTKHRSEAVRPVTRR